MKKLFIALGIILSLSSCFINEHIIGEGPQSNEVLRDKTVYILGNRVSKVNTKSVAGDAKDYKIDTRVNFLDMLVSSLTLGILNMRTVTVTK